MSALINSQLNDRYQLRERIGAGGMARVFKAWDAILERTVAIKILHDHLAEDSTFKERFMREAKFVAGLNHPHIVQVYDCGVEDRGGEPLYYMVMSYLPGMTLRDMLAQVNLREEKLSQERILSITVDIADALGYAHRQGMIHRDVKPGNILLDEKGNAVLTDFGIARMIESSRLTQDGISTGTPLYMSPEQVSGQAGDARSDLYSLGIILYEMLTGKPPFEDDGTLSVMMKHLTMEILPISNLLNIDNPTLDAMMNTVLAKEPSERYQDARAFIEVLQKVLAQPFVPRSTPPNPRATATRERLPSGTLPLPNNRPISSASTQNTTSSPVIVATPKRSSRWLPAAWIGIGAIVAIGLLIALMLIPRIGVTAPEAVLSSQRIAPDDVMFTTQFSADDTTNAYWTQGELGMLTRLITPDGFYALTNVRPNTAETSIVYAEQPYDRVSIEMYAQLQSDSAPASAYGIVYNYQNAEHYNVFAVDGLGRFSIWVRENGVWRELRSAAEQWTYRGIIRPAGEQNRLTIDLMNGDAIGYINGQGVVRIDEVTMPPGNIGIYVASDDGEATVLVDSYRVYPSVPSMTSPIS